jgi:hypothetical protein
MHQFTHAWLAFLAIKRLAKVVEKSKLPEVDQKFKLSETEREYAESLIAWFHNNKDGVIQGAWYPDTVIHDNSTGHILKITPYDEAKKEAIEKEVKENRMKVIYPAGFKSLPEEYAHFSELGKDYELRKKPCVVDLGTNLPDRCESLTHTVIDHFKIQWQEEKGSPVSPTSNQVALLFFMQSHYVADAHVPVHCDSRDFSHGKKLHAKLEDAWEKKVTACFEIDTSDSKNPRFFYDTEGYPLVTDEKEYKDSYLETADTDVIKRKIGSIDSLFKSENNNVWDFMSAVCQNSYLLSYYFFDPAEIPEPTQAVFADWESAHPEQFKKLSAAVLADAADSIARVWLRSWRRFDVWKTDRIKEEEKEKKKIEARQEKEALKNKQLAVVKIGSEVKQP